MRQSTQRLRPIQDVAADLGLRADDLVPYGDFKAKVKMAAVRQLMESPPHQGRLILTTAITPTAAGEGKTTVSIGLSQALNRIGKTTTVALREPSLGPCIGIKGGATGGGRSMVQPMDEINLHFTGDLHAVSAAHNLIAAAVDNHIHFNNELALSPRRLSWNRVLDMNDRALRDVVIGLGGHGVPRQTGFDITAASEVMAILCLSRSYQDLKERLGRILLGMTDAGEPVSLAQLGVQGAAAALLKDALLPNLAQTTEGTPALIHGGPFANLAQGANSVLATRLALATSPHVVTEAGFGADLGAEKFFDIVCPNGSFTPAAVVLVATVKALKLHGGVRVRDLVQTDPAAVTAGRGNLEKHIENIRRFGREPIVAINRFAGDSQAELDAVAEICTASRTQYAVADIFAEGGAGGSQLAELVAAAAAQAPPPHTTVYDWDATPRKKIETLAREIYGADKVEYQPKARADLRTVERHGFAKLPICMAKTPNSLSDNPALLGRPSGFTLTVREVIISAGAGFLVPLTGEIMRMPGLPRSPAANNIDITEDGIITGLF